MGILHTFPARSNRPGAQADSAAIHFACDPASHQICVVDAEGLLLEAFGEEGTLPGQFACPSDVIVVSPRFDGEDTQSDHLAVVVVADRGNNRVQVFEPEGQLVAIIGGSNDGCGAAVSDRAPLTAAPSCGASANGHTPSSRDGWPFFRLDSYPHLNDPVALRWEDPWLVVIDGQGAETRIDLAAALLPSFADWLGSASGPMLLAAHHHFRHKARHEAMAEPLSAIETALGDAWLASGDVEAVARLWSLSWAPHVTTAVRDRQVALRDRAAMRAAFRLGRASAVARVRGAIRQSLGAFATWPVLDGSRGGRATREAS